MKLICYVETRFCFFAYTSMQQQNSLPKDLASDLFYRTVLLLVTLMDDPVLTRAADQLHISVSTASRQLSKAREWYGDPLFAYSAGRMFPTRKMEELAPKLRNIIANIDGLFDEPPVFDPASAVGNIRIVAVDNAFFTLLKPVIVELRKEAPGVHFQVFGRSTNLLNELRDGSIDLAFYSSEGKEIPAGFTEHTLFESDHLLLMRKGHPLAVRYREKRALTLDDVARYCHIGVAIRMDSSEDRFVIGQQARLNDNIACEMPYFVAGASLAAETDMVMRIPIETGLLISKQFEVDIVPQERELKLPWRPGLFWYQSTQHSPLLTWVRAKIMFHARVIHEEAKNFGRQAG